MATYHPIAKGTTSTLAAERVERVSYFTSYGSYASAAADAALAEGSWYTLWVGGNYIGPANNGWSAYYRFAYPVGDFTGGFAVARAGNAALTITVPASPPDSTHYSVFYHYDTSVVGNPGNYHIEATVITVYMSPVCLTELVTVGEPTWNASTNQWDYLVTITGQGGTPPYSSSPPSPATVSLAPATSTTLLSTTTDSGSPQCSASNSTPIGPADIPPGPPIEGEGPTVDDEEDSDIFPIDYPSGGNPTCPLTSNQMKAQAQTTGTVTLSGSSKSAQGNRKYGSGARFAASNPSYRSGDGAKGKIGVNVGR